MTATDLRCSFCNKSQRDVRKLVAGPNAYICDECVDICVDVITEDRKDAPAGAPVPTEPPPQAVPYHLLTQCSLCSLPVPVEHMLAVESRGGLCPGCIGAIEAAIAVSREDEG